VASPVPDANFVKETGNRNQQIKVETSHYDRCLEKAAKFGAVAGSVTGASGVIAGAISGAAAGSVVPGLKNFTSQKQFPKTLNSNSVWHSHRFHYWSCWGCSHRRGSISGSWSCDV
jgi:hypothetical protein